MGSMTASIKFIIFLASFVFLLLAFNSSSLTDLDYRISNLTYSDGEVSGEESFQGSNSAKLSVFDKDRFARIYIDFEDPFFLRDLDQLTMWILPFSGDGEIQIEIYLDDIDEDEVILSVRRDLSDMEPSQWNELDGFDLEYSGNRRLDKIIEEMGDRLITKIWITFYSDSDEGETIAYFDYINIAGDIISFEPLEEEDVKDGPSSASAGGLITYTITYGNNMMEPVDVIVTEDYDSETTFISADPPPDQGTVDTWTFYDLPPGAHGQIKIKVRSRKPSAKASISGSVSGEGYTCVQGMLSTEKKAYSVKNTVHISAGDFNFTQSVYTNIRPVIGFVLQYGEHGSGSYHSVEKLKYSPTSIILSRDFQAAGSFARLNLTSNRSLSLRGGWAGTLRAENDYRDIIWSDRYSEGRRLNLSYNARLGKPRSSLKTEASIEGLANRRALWPGGFAETYLSGDFNLTGEAEWRWANKTVPRDKEWLLCCPPEEEKRQ